MIKKIYCLGTSHTRGAGFHLPEAKEIYNRIVNTPSMETCSWPGILKTYLDDIEVINLSECGAGNERMYRTVFDIVSSENFKKEECLFLLEFSNLGRKEFYSNTIDDYVICNYLSTHPPGNNFDVVWKYYENENLLSKSIKKIYEDFLVETVNFDDLLQKLQMNILFFLNFLKNNEINFELTVFEDIFSPTQKKIFNLEHESIKYEINGKLLPSFYCKEVHENYLFEHETNNVIKDEHQGYWITEIAAKSIFNYLVRKKYIQKDIKEIKNKHSDFLEFKSKLNLKNFLI